MEDELWLKKIKDKLEDYSEPLPVAGWERLEKELSLSGTRMGLWQTKPVGNGYSLWYSA